MSNSGAYDVQIQRNEIMKFRTRTILELKWWGINLYLKSTMNCRKQNSTFDCRSAFLEGLDICKQRKVLWNWKFARWPKCKNFRRMSCCSPAGPMLGSSPGHNDNKFLQMQNRCGFERGPYRQWTWLLTFWIQIRCYWCTGAWWSP